MAVVLYDDGTHKCVVFTDLVTGEGVQANQFAISHNGEGGVARSRWQFNLQTFVGRNL